MLRPGISADLADLCAVINRAHHADGIPQIVAVDEFAEELEADEVDLSDDMRVATAGEAVVGYIHTLLIPSDVVHVRCYVFGDVDPDWRGQGIGTQLMTWGIARAKEQLVATGTQLPTRLRAQTGEEAEATRRLYERFGLRPVRYHEELLRPLVDLPQLGDPYGVRIIAWPDDRDDEILVVKNAAFEDHWGSTPTSPEGWASMVRGFASRPDLSFIALDADSDELIGHCLNKRFEDDDAITGRRDALIDNLGTVRHARSRGVASALIARSLHAFAEAGLTHALISVDSESPSGAARLYRSLGFTHVRGDFTYELPTTA